MRQCNDEIQSGGKLSGKINERFGITGGPLQSGEIAREFFRPLEKVTRWAKSYRLGGHLVKTKILTEAHCSLFKIDWPVVKKDLWYRSSNLKIYILTGSIELLKLYIIIKTFLQAL